MPNDPATIELLWHTFKQDGCPKARERLILHYAPLVKFVASRICVSLPRHIDGSDLMSYGVFGLIDSIEKFDPSRGIRFETYAAPRIKGSIMDELRAIDWIPRSVRDKARDVEAAETRLRQELRREPVPSEMAAELGFTESQLHLVRSQVSSTIPMSLDRPAAKTGDGDSVATLGDRLADTSSDPAAVCASWDLQERTAEAIQRLKPRARRVLMMYFFEHLTLAEIGARLGITESRASQIRAEALRSLRSRLVSVGYSESIPLETDGSWRVRVPV